MVYYAIRQVNLGYYVHVGWRHRLRTYPKLWPKRATAIQVANRFFYRNKTELEIVEFEVVERGKGG